MTHPVPDKGADVGLQQERAILDAYLDTAKSIVQLSTGALALSVTFMEKFVSASARDGLIIAAWALWLLAVVAGGTYQYVGVKRLEHLATEWGFLPARSHGTALGALARHPWLAYGTMLAAFYLGCACFATAAALRL